MKNNYLNLNIDDIQITKIINNLIKKLKSNISNSDFKKIIIELDSIHNDYLSDEDDDLICDCYDTLQFKCSKQIEHFITDTTPLLRGCNFGEFMNFLKYIGS